VRQKVAQYKSMGLRLRWETDVIGVPPLRAWLQSVACVPPIHKWLTCSAINKTCKALCSS